MKKEHRPNKYIYWIPRILSILFILFLAMFSLDIFDMNLGFWGTIVGLLMHNIPSFILTAVLVISWKYEIVGGIAFILAGLLYVVLMVVEGIRGGFGWDMILSLILIAGIPIAVGILFLIGWYKKKR
ncbi:MAG: hypothetical protein KJ574_00875 [Nanoarchaeota archaeon]|nr:hypothetical protein [Nanoarchaeota archaeon]